MYDNMWFMSAFPTPVVVVSQCLGFGACRYDGEMLSDDFVSTLGRFAKLLPVCPEIEIGLGVPRDPIRIVEHNAGRQLLQPSTGRDLTGAMSDFTSRYLTGLAIVDAFILKSRSPSCGIRGTKIFVDTTTEDHFTTGPGLFARVAREVFPGVACEDEEQLGNPRTRSAFLGRVFAAAAAREGVQLRKPYPAQLE